MDGLTHKLALAHIAMQVSGNENAPADIASIAGIERGELAKMLSGEDEVSESVMNAMAEVLGMDESMFEAAAMLDEPEKNEDQEEMKSLIKRKPKDSERKDDIGFQIKNIDLTSDAKYANIKGYGSVFGNVDLGGDVVVKGAFAKTLKDKGGKVPFLQDHKYDIDNFLGVITAEEDDYGLKSNIEVNLMTQKGREFYNKAKQCKENGLPMGLSIGYDIMDSEMDRSMGVLKLKELRLNEISATLFPMNTAATITDVKSELKEIEEKITLLKKSLHSEPSEDTHDEADLVKEIELLRSTIQTTKSV